MNMFNGFKENADVSETQKSDIPQISKEAQDKFNKLMGDDNPKNTLEDSSQTLESHALNIKEKFESLFEPNAVENIMQRESNKPLENSAENIIPSETQASREPNLIYELNSDIYETDDSGKTYKKNSELLPNTEYTINGSKYRTDENGNLISCDSEPKYTEEGSRNLKEQRESGGEGRLEDDDGGHIIAKILGGAEGSENLVPMRRTINRGDYKKMENEISKALQEGQKVIMHIDLEYETDSQRPSKIKAVYHIDGDKTEVLFDNDENSTELLDFLNTAISNEDYASLREELQDMREDGHLASITSVKTEYASQGNPTKITVGVLDEITGVKSYKVYASRGGE